MGLLIGYGVCEGLRHSLFIGYGCCMRRDGGGRKETKSPTARIRARHVEQFGNLAHPTCIHDTLMAQVGAEFGPLLCIFCALAPQRAVIQL